MRTTVIVVAGAALLATLVWTLGFVPCNDVFLGYGNQILSTTTQVWSSHGLSEHGLLAFYDVGDFDKRLAYVHASPPHLALFVLFTRIAMALSGKPVLEAQRYIPFLNWAVFVAVFCWVARAIAPRTRRQHAMVLLFLGAFLTQYDFWAVKEGSPINSIPMTAALLLASFPLLLAGRERSRASTLLSLAVCVFFPINGLAMVLALWAVHHADRALPFWARENLRDNLVVAAICGAALVTLAYPPTIASLLHFDHGGTPLLHRMGLDGQRSLYQNYYQALIKPYGYHFARPWSPQNPEWRFFPQLALLTASLAFAGRRWRECLTALDARALFVIASPYLMSLILFPQSLSVHPYLYDLLLSFTILFAAFRVATSPVFEAEVRGFRFMLYLIVVATFLLYQITDVAQVGFVKSGKPEILN
jgi:hypothetical protein